MAELRGPFFNTPWADTTMDAIVLGIEKHVAQVTYDRTMRNLKNSIRKPTPYYWTRVRVQQRIERHVVTDRGVVYGPWLEGVSKRNQETRFKGYFSFRRAAQSMQYRSIDIARADLDIQLKVLN